MKKISPVIIVLALVVILFLVGMGAYNGMVSAREKVNAQWANVENQYQRRSDVIPNLVETVKGYAKHESGTLEAVVHKPLK